MPLVVITSKAQFNEIVNGDKVVVVDFWANWCGPCRAIAPLYEQLSDDTPDVVFCKVNIDDCADIAEEAGVSVVPTFMSYKKGIKDSEVRGAVPEAVKAFVSKAAAA